jgi:hypothetical protein
MKDKSYERVWSAGRGEPAECVRGVRVTVPGGTHQRAPAILIYSLHIGAVPVNTLTVSVWPFLAARMVAAQPARSTASTSTQ